jgi:hypothetical protein
MSDDAGGLPEGWPRVFIEFRCENCLAANIEDGLQYSELVRPAMLAHWTQIAAYLGQKLLDHLRDCPNRPQRGNA